MIDVAMTPALADTRSPDRIAVIDVLRATTSIVQALEHGALAVVPARDPDEAVVTARRIGRDRCILAGERDGRPLVNFDLGNSPAGFERSVIEGKTIVMATTNGTRAILEAARWKPGAICAAFTNRAAVVDFLLAPPEGQHPNPAREALDIDVLLLCAADRGAPSFEDTLCAGAIAAGIRQQLPKTEITDAARIALALFDHFAAQLTGALARGTHAHHIAKIGYAADIFAASKLDSSAVVPIFVDGQLIRN